MSKKKTIHDRAVESELIYRRISKAEEGEVIPYDELSKIISMDVQRAGYKYLYRAKVMALRNDEIVFGAIRGEGVKRLNSEEIVVLCEDSSKRVRRATNRDIEKSSTIDYDSLSGEMKIRCSADRVKKAFTKQIYSEPTRRKMEERAKLAAERGTKVDDEMLLELKARMLSS